MDQTRESSTTEEESKQVESVSRSQSQDALDSSSTSSLSCFADHSDGQNSSGQGNDHRITDVRRSGDFSTRAPMDEALKSEKAFIEFVMSLPPKETPEHHHRSIDSVVVPKSKSPATASNTTKVGLDHLDNLCKLMEQLSELRDTNNKLQRRVQYLEDLKTLHDMHKEIKEETQYSSQETPAEQPRGYALQKSATETCCPKKQEMQASHLSYRSHSRYQSRRGRAQSTDGQRRERSKSVGHDDSTEDTKSKRIFPKWSKVKEAFGWESDRKDSVKMKVDGETGSVRTPRRRSEESHQSFHPAHSPTWSQDYPSLHSSLEDVSEILDAGRWKRCSVVSEKNIMHLEAPKEVLRRQKSTPSPGSEKLMSYRETTDLKPKSSTIERDTYSHQDYKEDGKRGKSPWGRVKTIIERRRDSLKRRSIRREHTCSECDSTPSKKDYTDYLDSTSAKPSESCKHKPFILEPIVIDQEVDYGGPRTPSSSPTFHRKSRWTRVKKALKGKKEDERDPSLSTPASANSTQGDHFTFDAIEEISQGSFEENKDIKRVESDSQVHQLVLSEPTCDLMLELQRNLSEDFHRKIEEWERIRSSGNASCSPHWNRKLSMTARSRKKSERDDKNIKPKLKDLSWLEKELQKIEKEKQRLSKERQKYEERALRLEKLKETVLNAKNSNKREVFVRTSAGEFRFEGISDAFTKKLYEWETKRGLGPELSTIALLDSSRLTVQPNIGVKSGPLQRVVSRSESSIADIGQPSHNSSNSLPSLKITDSMDAERTNHPSRANSEPDLSTLVALSNASNVSVSNLSRRVGDFLDDDITSPGVSRESEEDELDKTRNDSETYYGLLEENVILLEQLKDKEEICRKLEGELDVLDKRVDVMNKHHTQETERYREKLWEMHKPGATPRDVQCCLRTMAQLRKRIEVLEKCTVKLRNDRESVEDSFRYHSKQQEDMTLDLLQKMSELQAAGSSAAECESKEPIHQRVNASAVERLQDLSALLVKQTQELQETLSAKTRQICQLRWELLHRDLSTVKLETELHTHTAHRKRSKYAHFRSHSSEEAPVFTLPQELDRGKSTIITEAYYNATSPESEFQATQLTNTVQQLNREVLKLTNATEFTHELFHSGRSQVNITKLHGGKRRILLPFVVRGSDVVVTLGTIGRSEVNVTKLNGGKQRRTTFLTFTVCELTHELIHSDCSQVNITTLNGDKRRRTAFLTFNVCEYPYEDGSNTETYRINTNAEEPWSKPGWQLRNNDKTKQITVRRSSADNISLTSGNEGWKQNVSSVDSDDSSDDGYTKISFRTGGRNNYALNPNAERLLMSRGEHPPRSYLQRRKKLQRSSKVNSSPSRRRSNTFHNKRDFEKPIVWENTPQKCHSFRCPGQKIFNNTGSNVKLDTLNIRNLLGEVKYQEFLKKRGQMSQKSQVQTYMPVTRNIQRTETIAGNKVSDNHWLREVASDSKIPFLIQIQRGSEELSRDKHRGKCPVRSMSDKHKKESAAERREHLLKKKKQVTSPDLFSSLNKTVDNRTDMKSASFQKRSNIDSVNDYRTTVKNSPENSSKFLADSPADTLSANADAATVTIQLPKRKSKRIQSKVVENVAENTEHSVTVIIPKKRSLSSEQEYENSLTDSFKIKLADKYKQQGSSAKTENSKCSFTDSYSEKENTYIITENGANDIKDTELLKKDQETFMYGVDSGNETQHSEQLSRKRKAEDIDSLKGVTSCETSNTVTTKQPLQKSNNPLHLSISTQTSLPGYMKSPSATHLDWRKVCAKKVSREDASNVRSLIDKYNKVAESQSLRSTSSSTVNSPMSVRKISTPLFNSKSDHAVASYSYSTPSTPSVMPAMAFYNPLVFKPINLDLFPKSPPASPISIARGDAILKAKEQFISSQDTLNLLGNRNIDSSCNPSSPTFSDKIILGNHTPSSSNKTKSANAELKRLDDDRISNSSMDSMSYVMFRTGESCKESRLSKRSIDHSKTDSDILDRNKFKTSKSLSNSSIFKSVLNSDFKMPTTLLKLKRSKRKKDMNTVSHLCRQSLLLTPEDTAKVATQTLHKSCPSSPELKPKSEAKSSWFQRNILRHK